MQTKHCTFQALKVGDGSKNKVTLDDGSVLELAIDTLTPEDGSGTRYLINYQIPALNQGYIDFKTMKGWIKL